MSSHISSDGNIMSQKEVEYFRYFFRCMANNDIILDQTNSIQLTTIQQKYSTATSVNMGKCFVNQWLCYN